MQRPGNDNCKGATEANSATHRVSLGGSPFFTQSVLLMIEFFRGLPEPIWTSDRAANVVTASEAREPDAYVTVGVACYRPRCSGWFTSGEPSRTAHHASRTFVSCAPLRSQSHEGLRSRAE